jgi:hypothetical protein
MSDGGRGSSRRRRESEREQAAARRRRRSAALGAALVAVAAALVVVFALARGGDDARPTPTGSPRASDVDDLPGLQTGPPPWDAGEAGLAERLDAIGMPALPSEAFELHIHQHLDVFVKGDAVVVPASIGIDPAGHFISPLHTHDPSGVVHVESPTVQDFTLGQFFDVWGVRFNSRCIGGECAGGSDELSVFSNGEKVDGDPRALVLTEHQEIVVAFGTEDELPSPIPSRFRFPEGV